MKPKKLKDYKQEQLTLPRLFPEPIKSYSSTIELYDAVPKYVYEKRLKRIEGRFLETIRRRFEFRGKGFNVKISPARVETRNGKEKDYFPGLREELIEDALRQMITSQKSGVYLDNSASVTFTLYQLQKELKNRGHSYDLAQIKQGLFICSQTQITLESEKGDAVLTGSLFENIGLRTMNDWRGKGEKTRCFVIFNIMVTKSIKDHTFRPLNYVKCMSYNNTLARWLHKRLNHQYTQASHNAPYNILLTTIIRDSGRKRYAALRNNRRQVVKAINEMVEKEVLNRFEEKEIREGRALTDVKFTLYPSPIFIKEVKAVNAKIKKLRELGGPNL